MLVNFDLPGICLHDGGSICLVPPGSVLPIVSVRGGSIYWSLRIALGGIESHVTPVLLFGGSTGHLWPVQIPARRAI